MSAVQGQSSRLSVILRGTQSSRLVQCFSSHPEELQVMHVFNLFLKLGGNDFWIIFVVWPKEQHSFPNIDVACISLGSLSNHDGDAEDNVD